MKACPVCAKPDKFRRGGVELKCVPCCIRWLTPMTPAERKINAPIILYATSRAHMEAVRAAWKLIHPVDRRQTSREEETA